ncbi:hypothetical protein GALL_207070 [mine drainage metagenome]|uniref:Uncharacterized protein n=1 Tax=mine drainage metagenome TaxID=410659 RepID=A0A1J5RP18_9ZZZZ
MLVQRVELGVRLVQACIPMPVLINSRHWVAPVLATAPNNSGE